MPERPLQLQLSVRAARKAMLEGKSPREAVNIIRQMLADQDNIDASSSSGQSVQNNAEPGDRDRSG